jgi:CspA family cold shock protein
VTHTHEGFVKTWKADRGFGFCAVESPKGQRDVFLHISDANRCGIQNIAEGDKVRFNVVPDEKSGRSKATDIQMVI